MDLTVKNKGLRIGVLLSFLIMVTVNALASILPINGVGTGEVSAQYDTLFTPAAFAFAIWGPIYLLLAIYVIFQWLPAKEKGTAASQKRLRAVAMWFIVNGLVNAGWIFAWHYRHLTISLALMLLLLASLIRIGWLLRRPQGGAREELTLRAPFGLYFGWITVATIANAAVVLVSRHWNRFGLTDTFWTVTILLVGLLIAGVTMYRIRNVAYGLAVIWAYAWILVRQLSASGYAGAYPPIIAAAGFSLGVLLAVLTATIVRFRKKA